MSDEPEHTQDHGARAAVTPSRPLRERLHGLTQPEALIVIAREQGGLLKTTEAKRLLLDAKLITGNPKHALTHIIQLVQDPERFAKFGYCFEKVNPGEYRLLPVDSDEARSTIRVSPAMSPAYAADGALAAVTAQRDRLREALLIVARIADDRGQRLIPPYPARSLLSEEDSRRAMGLLPGDLGDEA